ncbi:lipoprotein-releasing ABC transporter permease subunit [Mesocricetibacter intestinalis]|uniref:lipoprotein-releasing ABC transporter permease subunit n=1 Tax=Mesocricetibacter intestinalis TaxID=1521930 RepID=UPI00105F6A4D|nr:lipoprotein-releasing ABC transporter permease subunit [Mesocricetibacter intestinalis]
MNFPISLYIALRYWRAKSADRFGRLVSNLASGGIVLGVMALIIVLSVMNGLEQQQKQQVLADIPQAVLTPKEGETLPLAGQIPQMPGFVHKAVAVNIANVIFQTEKGLSAGQVIGVRDFSDDNLLRSVAAQPFEQLLPEGEFKLVIGEGLAQNLQLGIGDKLRLMVTENSQYTPFGRVPVQRLFSVSAIYQGGNYELSGYEAFANLADIGRLMRISPERIQGYRLFLQDPFRITELPAFFSPQEWRLNDWRSQKGEFFQAVRMEKNMMGLLVGLIIVVAVSNIITSLSLMVVDKQGEIAILQTQGLDKTQVRRIFILQGCLVGVCGTLLGTLLGIVISLNLDAIIALINPHGVFLPSRPDMGQIMIIAAFSLLLSLLSTLYPAYRAAKIEPAQALRYE